MKGIDVAGVWVQYFFMTTIEFPIPNKHRPETPELNTSALPKKQTPHVLPSGVLAWQTDSAQSSAPVFDPRSQYVETFWLPILGPSSILLLRNLAARFELCPQGFAFEAEQLSSEIGLGTKLSRRSPFVRTLERLEVFQMAYIDGPILYVRRQIPLLSYHRTKRLAQHLVIKHQEWLALAEERDISVVGTNRHAQHSQHSQLRRAGAIAKALSALGESATEIEQQLQQWQFHPAVIFNAVASINTTNTEPKELRSDTATMRIAS